MQQSTGMLANRRSDVGVAIAQGVDGDAGDAVEVLLAGGVIQVTAVTALDDEARPAVGLQNVLIVEGDNIGCHSDSLRVISVITWR